MRYPTVRYVETGDPGYLELHCYDGTRRGVMFVDAVAADEAMRPGRAELDCVAVLHGFLPRGATLVSSPGVLDEFFEGDANGLARARFVAAAAGYVTQNSDELTRRKLPGAAQRYDGMSHEFELARSR